MNYKIVAITSNVPTLSVTPIVMDVGGRSHLVEFTDQQAIQIAATLLDAVNLNRKER